MDAFTLFAKLKMDSTEFDKDMTESEKKAESFGGKLKNGLGTAAKVGAAAVAAVATATAVVGKTMVSNAKEVAAYGDNIDKMSQKIGISAEAYQEWDAVFQHSGANVNSLQQGMKTLNNQINKVKDAATLAKSPFAQLGLSLEEVQAIAKDPDKALETVISHLQELPAGAERSALATQLLGRSGVELGALLNTTAEETKNMRDRVHELGGVMSDEAVKAAAAFQDNMQDLHTALDGIKRSITADTLPAFNSLIDGFTKLIAGEEGAEEAIDKGVAQMEKAIDKIIPKLGDILEKLLPRVIDIGGKLVIALAKQVPKIITSVAKQLPSLIKGLLTALDGMIPQIFDAGAELLEEFASGAESGTGEMIDVIMNVINTLLTTISNNLPRLVTAGLTLIENLAMGIINNLDKIIDGAGEAIVTFVSTITKKLPEILTKGKDVIVNLVKGIIEKLPDIIESAVKIIGELVKGIAENLGDLVQAGIDIIVELAQCIIDALPKLIERLPEIISAITDNLFGGDAIEKLLDAGLSIIGKLFEGILNGDFLKLIGDIIVALGAAVVKSVGALRQMGEEIAYKIIEGFMKAWSTLKDWVTGSIGDLNSRIQIEAQNRGLTEGGTTRSYGGTTPSASPTGGDYAGSNSMVARYAVYVGSNKVGSGTAQAITQHNAISGGN